MRRLSDIVPGGAHTNSKGDINFPPNAPAKLARGQGGTVYDSTGKPYVDWGMGINNVLVGHAELGIDSAAILALKNGQAFCRPSELEEAAAEAVLKMFPDGEMVKFTKTGSSANDAAIKLARAVTGRPWFAFDSTAPFLSTSDWFCRSKANHNGTIATANALAFGFNDVYGLESAFDGLPLACVILELCRTEAPTQAFLDALVSLCQEHGTLLVVDEVVTGFRYGLRGACGLYGIKPDLFTIGKGLGNGYSVAALVGKREYMKRGGEDVFLLSTTNGAEQSGLAAAIATIAFYQKHDVIDELACQGRELVNIVERAALLHGIRGVQIRTDFDCRPVLRLPQAIKETFHSALIEQGVLWPYPWCCPTYRRTAQEMQQTARAVSYAFEQVAKQ